MKNWMMVWKSQTLAIADCSAAAAVVVVVELVVKRKTVDQSLSMKSHSLVQLLRES